MLQLPFRYKAVTTILLVIAAAIVVIAVAPKDKQEPSYYRPYLGLLKEVYDVMDRDYYKPVSKEAYDDYLIKYKESILGKLTDKEKVVDMVMWRGAGLLVERLRDPRDRFTSFIPPKMAENYEKNIYGFEYDLGISGNLTKDGYLITFVEKRSDAFKKGIKPGWVILEIDGKALAALKEDDIKKLLSPPKDATARLMMLLPGGQKAQAFELVSTKYFKETVFNVPTGMDGTYCFQIAKFNEQTSADMRELIVECQKKGIKFLILDLRNNPGGPPLAVRELAGLFLKPGSNLFYYKKKNIAPFGLITPNSDVHYGGPFSLWSTK
jgi:C-terminal processing protease CtpA/Prc